MYLLKTLDGEYFFSNSTGNDSSVSIVDEIDDNLWEKIAGHREWFAVERDKFILLKSEEEINKEIIRQRREEECFKVIDRSELWYEGLSEENKEELREWYQVWLKAPQTGIVPEKLEWIK